VGVAQTPVQVRVADEQGRDLPVGEAGEVLVRGDTVMAGYWRNPEASAAALRDGWLWTGDVGCLDADGFLTLKDRSKDLLISGGSNIYPREVEEGAADGARRGRSRGGGRPDPEWGEIVVGLRRGSAGARLTDAALDAHCAWSTSRASSDRSATSSSTNCQESLRQGAEDRAARRPAVPWCRAPRRHRIGDKIVRQHVLSPCRLASDQGRAGAIADRRRKPRSGAATMNTSYRHARNVKAAYRRSRRRCVRHLCLAAVGEPRSSTPPRAPSIARAAAASKTVRAPARGDRSQLRVGSTPVSSKGAKGALSGRSPAVHL
jgi:hypothetical protein